MLNKKGENKNFNIYCENKFNDESLNNIYNMLMFLFEELEYVNNYDEYKLGALQGHIVDAISILKDN